MSDEQQSEEAAHSCVPLAHPTLPGMTVSTGQGDTRVTDGFVGSRGTSGNRLGNPGLLTNSHGGWRPEKDTS